jgi:ubiquitin-like domain-containing CTD phosphatase 1
MQYYNEKNTIMFDDLRRNFIMNPQNGLVIKPFRKAHSNRHDDHELVKLTHYLLSIGDLEDLSKLDHGKWESFVDESVKRRKQGLSERKTEHLFCFVFSATDSTQIRVTE